MDVVVEGCRESLQNDVYHRSVREHDQMLVVIERTAPKDLIYCDVPTQGESGCHAGVDVSGGPKFLSTA